MKYFKDKKEKFTFSINSQDFLRWVKEIQDRASKGYDWYNNSIVIRGSDREDTHYFFNISNTKYRENIILRIEKRSLCPIWTLENEKSNDTEPENGGEGENSSQII